MPRGALGPSRMAGLAALLSVAMLLPVARAGAEGPSQYEYHEVTRFGGLDEAAFAGGNPTPGKFMEPTGFAVDPVEGEEAIYVADRTSSPEGVECTTNSTSKRCAEWRIQKLSSTGAVLGTTTFTLPVGAEQLSGGREAPSMIAGLAVDHAAGRLYALVMGPLAPGNAYREHATAAQELLAWSTSPSPCTGKCETGGALTAAAGEGIGSDPLGSTGGLVSSEAQLDSGKTPLYDPQGIVVDRLDSPGVDDPVAIEASNLKGSIPADEASTALHSEKIGRREFELNGDTVVQQVATQKETGAKGESLTTGGLRGEPWSGASVASQLGTSRGPLGIFDDPDGHISVLLRGSELSATNAYLVRLKPDLSNPEVLSSDQQESQKLEQAAMTLDAGPFFDDPGESTERDFLRNGANEVWGAGPEVAELSSELYAADFFLPEPDCSGTPGYWHTEELRRSCRARNPPFVQQPGANVGVRLLRPASSGLISSPQGQTIANTIGDEHTEGGGRPEAHSPCEIGAQDAALAAGGRGSLWVFDRGPTSGKLVEGAEQGGFVGTRSEAAEGREIIELAPGEGTPQSECPQPSGTFTMSLCGSGKPAASGLTVPAGAPVTFDASAVNLAHGTPFSYTWGFGDGSQGHNETEPHAFSKAGSYDVTLSVRSDFGEYVTSATVQVEPSDATAHPSAQFTVSSPKGAQVAFDATGSSAGTCNNIYDYRWEWGDGSPPQDAQKPTVEHSFPTASEAHTYEVRLTVVSSPTYERASTVQTVEVSPAAASVIEGLPPLEALVPGPDQTAPVVSQAHPAQTPPAPARGPTYLSPRASFSRGTVSVRISCPAAKVQCRGSVQLETAAAYPAGLARSGQAERGRRTGRVVVGSAPFSLRGGSSGTVAVHLTARGALLLARVRRLPLLVTVSARDPLGDPGVALLRLTLTAPRSARR